MKQLGIVLVFGLGVGVGCAAGTAVRTQVAEAQAEDPVMPAEGRSGVTRWEYKCEFTAAKAPKKFEELANSLGVDGWEAFTDPSATWCFKRPLP